MIHLAPYIDHTALRPQTTHEDIRLLCEQAVEFGFAAVCVMPSWVPLARAALDSLDSSFALATTVGFPLGAHRTAVKVAEATQAVDDGATELDMVMNVGALLSGDTDAVQRDISAVVDLAHSRNAIVKVILENALLDDRQIALACRIAERSGADYVKTSTGFAASGATVGDVRLMRQSVGPQVAVKAAGGIRSRSQALAMIDAGATRIGTSAGVVLVTAQEEDTVE